MIPPFGIWRIFTALSFTACGVALGQQAPASPAAGDAARPHPLRRYESLWTTPLFSRPAPPEVEAPPAPPAAPVYRLLGMGTTRAAIELAYVQSIQGGRILEVTRNAMSGPVLIGVERTFDGRVDAVVFRNGNEVIRAVASAAPAPAGEFSLSSQAAQPAVEAASSFRVPARLRNRAVTLPQ